LEKVITVLGTYSSSFTLTNSNKNKRYGNTRTLVTIENQF